MYKDTALFACQGPNTIRVDTGLTQASSDTGDMNRNWMRSFDLYNAMFLLKQKSSAIFPIDIFQG